MGISSLLLNIKSITKSGTHISAHKDSKIAVDSYCWLHKCAYSCSRELVEDCGNQDVFVHAFLNRARMLKNSTGSSEVTYVFDGASLPSKAREEKQRRQRREAAKDMARKAWSEGNRKLAFDCYGKALDVTFEMAKRVMDAIEREGLGRVLVAPFEADAQLAYLCKNGYADVVITEDSDMLAHGAPIVFYKMDNNGIGDEIRYEDLPRNRGLRFDQFTPDLFLQMCCMSGCDYLPSLPNVGMKKAHQAMRKCREYGAALRSFKFEGIRVDKEYESGFRDALITFKHALVYCPTRKKCVNLSDCAEDDGVPCEDVLNLRFSKEDEKRLLGERRVDAVCEGVANGKLHPVSLKPYPPQRELPKSNRNFSTNTTTNNNSNNRMTMNNYFTNRKDEGGAMIFGQQHQHQPRSATTSNAPKMQPNRPIVRSTFFANALKDDEEEKNRREALKRYAAKPSTFDAFEYSNNSALLPMNRATPELSLQSPMKKRVVKKFDLYGTASKNTPEDTKKKSMVESSPSALLNTAVRKSPRLTKIRSSALDNNDDDDNATPATGKKTVDFLENFRFDSTSSKKKALSGRKTTVIPSTVSVGKKKKAVSSLPKTTTTTTSKKKRRTSKRLSAGGERTSAAALFSEFALHSNNDEK